MPVSHRIAKLLKKNGFNEPCYMVSKKGVYYKVDGAEFTMIDGVMFQTTTNSKLPDNFFTAPTIEQAVDWFEKTYGVWIYVTPFSNASKTKIFWESHAKGSSIKTISSSSRDYLKYRRFMDDFVSSKQAIEAAFEFFLTDQHKK